jgi:hypothetical protein
MQRQVDYYLCTDYKMWFYEQEGIIGERIENISKNTQLYLQQWQWQ